MKYDISEVRKELDTLLHWTWWELKIVSDHLMTDNDGYNEEDYCQFKEDFFELSIMLNSLEHIVGEKYTCLLYTSPSPRDRTRSRMPSSA